MNLQVFQYQNSPITFSLDGDVMVNATQMAKPFGKLPADFVRLDQTQAFCSALATRLNMGNPIIKQEAGRYGGTWMHQKLALKFAAWLSPEFELWVYDRIEELLLTGQTTIKPLSKQETIHQAFLYLQQDNEALQQQNLLLESANEILAEERTALACTVKVLAPKADMYDAMHGDDNGITVTTIAKELGLPSAEALNNILAKLKVQYKVKNDGKWVLFSQYQGKGYTVDVPHKYYDKNQVEHVSLRMQWTGKGRLLIHSLVNPKLKGA